MTTKTVLLLGFFTTYFNRISSTSCRNDTPSPFQLLNQTEQLSTDSIRILHRVPQQKLGHHIFLLYLFCQMSTNFDKIWYTVSQVNYQTYLKQEANQLVGQDKTPQY